MRTRIELAPTDIVPARASILALQGIPAEARVPARIAALVDEAIAACNAAAEPRAVLDDVSASEFLAIYEGDGLNAERTPLASIAPSAEQLALAAATLGGRISARIAALLGRRELALASMLDATASASVDRFVDLICARYAGRGSAREETTVLAYSPGYCGWHLTGQRALFRRLRPGEIGITLNDRCLMEPLKSVSGVIVAGKREIHRFRPDFPFCRDCRDRQCRARMPAGDPATVETAP